MPGTLCACWLEVGENMAPLPMSSSLWMSPASSRFISHPQATEATQPQPLPPAWASCSW